jgi:hypothetical protein
MCSTDRLDKVPLAIRCLFKIHASGDARRRSANRPTNVLLVLLNRTSRTSLSPLRHLQAIPIHSLVSEEPFNPFHTTSRWCRHERVGYNLSTIENRTIRLDLSGNMRSPRRPASSVFPNDVWNVMTKI